MSLRQSFQLLCDSQSHPGGRLSLTPPVPLAKKTGRKRNVTEARGRTVHEKRFERAGSDPEPTLVGKDSNVARCANGPTPGPTATRTYGPNNSPNGCMPITGIDPMAASMPKHPSADFGISEDNLLRPHI